MIVVGTTMPATRSATMPIDSSTPKSCTIGTFEIRTVRNAITAATVATSSGGPRWRIVSPNASGSRSTERSSSIRFCIWIENSMPRPIRIGSPAMVTSDSMVPVEPERAESPHDADEHADQRQQPPAHLERDDQDHHHHPDGDGAEGEHAALQVVVDVGEEGRGAGDDHARIAEVAAGERILHRSEPAASPSSGALPVSTAAKIAWRASGTNARSAVRTTSWSSAAPRARRRRRARSRRCRTRGTHPGGVVEALVAGGAEPQRGDHRVGPATLLRRRVGLAFDRPGEDLAGGAGGDQVVGPREQRDR
jgi:hypothetical protein